MTTAHTDTDVRKGPFDQIKPRWIAENLALAALGFGAGHLTGGAAAGLVAGHPSMQSLDPDTKKRIAQTFKAIGGSGGAATMFALSQMRAAMTERLRQKRLHAERAERRKREPSRAKVASVLSERGWR